MLRDQINCPIVDVRLWPLVKHADGRGTFAEVFRACWDSALRPVQWGIVHSTTNVLRGVHVHVRHVDYVLVMAGRMLLGLADLREDSATFQTGCVLDLDADSLMAVEIPPGIAHGFYFPGPNLLLHGASEYFDPADDLGCHWNDPALNMPWPRIDPILSPRDQENGSVAELLAERRRRLAEANFPRRAAA